MNNIIAEETVKVFKIKPATPIKVIPKNPKEIIHTGFVTENNKTSLTYMIYDGFSNKTRSYKLQSKDYGWLYHIEVLKFETE